jgi:hypothetical protein
MSKSALLDLIPEERRKVFYHEEDGRTYIETRQDLTPVIRAAKILSERRPNKDFTRVALIPKETLNKALLEGWFHDESAWRKWANDPANKLFRTTEGTI